MRKSKEAELSDSKDPKTLQDADRIEFIRSDRWINYEVARDALARLNDLLIFRRETHALPVNLWRDWHGEERRLSENSCEIMQLFSIAQPASRACLWCLFKCRPCRRRGPFTMNSFWRWEPGSD